MEVVDGIPGQLPSLAPFPAPEVRHSLPSGEWQACLDAWISTIKVRLRLLPEHFACLRFSQTASGVPFLTSYFFSSFPQEHSVASFSLKGDKEHKLRHHCSMLLRRLLLEGQTPYDCSAIDLFNLLSKASIQLRGSQLWKYTLQQAWQRQELTLSVAVEEAKAHLIKVFAAGGKDRFTVIEQLLPRVTALSQCLPQAGRIVMTGSDYIDSLIGSCNDLPSMLDPSIGQGLRKLLVENLFSGLHSLMKADNPSPSLLLDVLYNLKTSVEVETENYSHKPTILSGLVCMTTFVRRLEIFLAAFSNTRGDSISQFLHSYKEKMSHLHPIERATRRRTRSGKGKSRIANATHEMHIHKASQISQIHELFPDVPTSYVMRLLDHFSDDIEAVTAALLEPDSLPQDLQNQNESANLSNEKPSPHLKGQNLQSRSPSLPPSRRNVFDGDEFDRLQISTAQVHIGRKKYDEEGALDPSDKAKKKAAIMAALATFDSDDDERDDTYDIADVGGAVDNTVDTDEKLGSRKSDEDDINEQTLYKTWMTNPELFARDSRTRLSQPRQQLKGDTGMTNEQIEGWALLLSRNSVQQRKLEHKYADRVGFGGQQTALVASKWSAASPGTSTEDGAAATESESLNESARSGEAAGRRGTRVGTRGGKVSRSPSNGPGSQSLGGHRGQVRGRGRGRGRGGGERGGNPNHNRRDGRARKMAGRGFGGPRQPDVQ